MNTHKKFDMIKGELETGMSPSEVSEALGISQRVVQRVFRWWKCGLSDDITDDEKISIITGERYTNMEWRLREVTEERVSKMTSAGYSLNSIADTLGITKVRVCQIKRELGLGEQKSRVKPEPEPEMCEKEVFRPQKVTFYSKKYLDITQLFNG